MGNLLEINLIIIIKIMIILSMHLIIISENPKEITIQVREISVYLNRKGFLRTVKITQDLAM
jgi:hypothetical protein